MKKLILLLTASLTFIFLNIGCSNDLKDLQQDFNKYFTKTDIEQSDAEPDDEDFDASLMLDEMYTVKVSGKTGMFQASAPKSDTYSWNIYDPEELSSVANRIPDVELTDRYLVIEYSTSNLELGKTYLITLVVTDKEGKRYSDSALLLFCKWYDGNTVDNLVTEITSEEDNQTSADESEEVETSDDKSGEGNTSTDSSEEFTDETSETETSEENV